MTDEDDWLPELWTLPKAGGDWSTFVESAYDIFRRDFVDSQPLFRRLQVRCRRDPIEEDGKEAGFWHCTSEGPNEPDRVPALRRCERIAWVRAIIENSIEPGVDVWENERNKEVRTVLWYREEFLVVLAARSRYRDGFRYFQLITAYDSPEKHRKQNLRKERDEYRKRLTPPPR